MQLRKLVSVSLIIALLSSCNFAWANGLYERTNLRVRDTSMNETITDKSPGSAGKAKTLHSHAIREKVPDAPLVERFLLDGKLQVGEETLLAELKEHTNDDQLRFGLGMLQFLRAVERLSQDLCHYGLRGLSTGGLRIPFLRLPVQNNPEPEALSYAQARKFAETFLENLAQAEATLAKINDANLKLPLHFGMIRLDLNGDGQVDEDESLWKLYANMSGNTHVSVQEAKRFVIKFDRGDVHWLRGYCHLLMSICEVYLAYDSKETFDCTAHLFFTNVDSPYKFLSKGKHVHVIGSDDLDVLDLVALVHTIRWPVAEPKRMESALHHLEVVVAQSKESWKWIMAETDDDHEWLPNPKQTGVIPHVHVTKEMVNAWGDLMDQSGKLLAGELLIPFWRGDDGSGINLRKVFMEPRALDLVLWVQGSAAIPYLQKGEMTKLDIWRNVPEVFGRHYPGFAIWFN